MISVLVSAAILQTTRVYDPKPLPSWAFTVDLSSSDDTVESRFGAPYRVMDVTNLVPDEADYRFCKVLPALPTGRSRATDPSGSYSLFRREINGLSRVIALGPQNELSAYALAAFVRPDRMFLSWAKHLRSTYGPPTVAHKIEGKRWSPNYSNVALVWIFQRYEPTSRLLMGLIYTPGYKSKLRGKVKSVPAQTLLMLSDPSCPRDIFSELDKPR